MLIHAAMAATSKPSQYHHSSQTPRAMPEESSLPRSSWSSVSSASTSDLSSTYVLSPADDTPATHHRGATASRSNRRQCNEPSTQKDMRSKQKREQEAVPPTITFFPPSPSASMLSVNTYDSQFSEYGLNYDDNFSNDEPRPVHLSAPDDASIPPVLRPYNASPSDPPVRPSDPYTFSHLFPSMDRLSIRHDDTTSDGNMNLRVETVIAPNSASRNAAYAILGSRRRPTTIQLFHLRMHDLANRDFSFRRYCRDSGREVCFSKRGYTESPSASGGVIHHSVSSALRSVKAPFHRSNGSNSSLFSLKTLSTARRPSTSSNATAKSSASSCGSAGSSDSSSDLLADRTPSKYLSPTDTIKLQFSNYARVEVSRRGLKRYEFEWWGHKYTWQRSFDKMLNTFSFHLIRDGLDEPVAHIAQETRSPTQVEADEQAGGWIPPCHMWISDQSVIEAKTDVADVIISTGLMALVDGCIRERWQSKKAVSGPAPLRNQSPHLGSDPAEDEEQSMNHGLFSRRRGQKVGKPFRLGRAVAVY